MSVFSYEEVPQVLNHTYNSGHRYEYIPDTVPSPPTSPKRPSIKDGYALVRKNDRYEFLPLEKISDTYRYHSPQKSGARYEAPEKSAVATRKLQELLSTPQKKVVVQRDPFVKTSPPKAQQRLNYAIGSRSVENKRHTAIVAPMCSNPYGDTTYYGNRAESWMNLSMSKGPVQATLTAAAVLMVLCGAVTSGLCFYMVSVLGRLYYLDFGIVAGFTCLILGLLGFRSRHCYWLPNRNYISGLHLLIIFFQFFLTTPLSSPERLHNPQRLQPLNQRRSPRPPRSPTETRNTFSRYDFRRSLRHFCPLFGAGFGRRRRQLLLQVSTP